MRYLKMTQSLNDNIEVDSVYRHSELIEPDFTVTHKLSNNTRIGGHTSEGDYIVIPKGVLLTCYHKITDFSKAQGDSRVGVKSNTKNIWEHKEDEINNIDGYGAFDVLKRMLGG